MGKFRAYSTTQEPVRILKLDPQATHFADGANQSSANRSNLRLNPPSILVRSQPKSTEGVWVSLRKWSTAS